MVSKARSVRKAVSAKKGFHVTLVVKNGPFQKKDDAQRARAVLQSRGINTTSPVKVANGYKFTSKLGYQVPSTELKNKVVTALRKKASETGLPSSAVNITVKKY